LRGAWQIKLITYGSGDKSEEGYMHKKEHENTSGELEGKTDHEQSTSK
jgi:hypothetical protein